MLWDGNKIICIACDSERTYVHVRDEVVYGVRVGDLESFACQDCDCHWETAEFAQRNLERAEKAGAYGATH
jgi:hypothetical protein